MSRFRAEPNPVLPEADTWEAPFRLSADDLYLQAGVDCRGGRPPVDDREDDR